MAKDYPHVQFTSVDNTPLVPHTPRSNIAFEVYDLYNGIAERSNTFDIVHLRHADVHVSVSALIVIQLWLTYTQLKNPKVLIREIYRVLRPGGLFIFGNWEPSVHEAAVPERPALERLPHLSAALELSKQGLAHQGVDVNMCHDMPLWLAPGSDVWTVPEESPSGFVNPFAEQMLGFRDIGYNVFLVPIGSWPTDKRMKDVGAIGQHGWAQHWRSMYAPFQVFGLSAEDAQQVVDKAIADLATPDVQAAVKYHATFGFKRGQTYA
jgi:SAM-dependent methyltransferase